MGLYESFKDYVKHKEGTNINEGSWTNEGLFWLEPGGKIHELPSHQGHEEWANEVLNKSLEELLGNRWVRIQSLPGQYMFIDHRQHQPLNATQADRLEGFFFEKDMSAKSYPKGFVISRSSSKYQDFGPNDAMRALEFAITGEMLPARPKPGEKEDYYAPQW